METPFDFLLASFDDVAISRNPGWGILYQNNLVSTSMRRRHVASTLMRSHFTPYGRCEGAMNFPSRRSNLFSLTSWRMGGGGEGAKFKMAELLPLKVSSSYTYFYIIKPGLSLVCWNPKPPVV